MCNRAVIAGMRDDAQRAEFLLHFVKDFVIEYHARNLRSVSKPGRKEVIC